MEVIAKYPCSESTLYAASRRLWEAYRQHHQELFEGFRSYYTLAYGQDALNEIRYAEGLPDYQTRTAEAEGMRAQAVRQAQICLTAWQDLKAYIWDAFPDDAERKAMLEKAGALHYRKASKEDWAALTALMQAGKLFLQAHTPELTADDNMPAGFVKTFIVAADRFEDYLRKLNQVSAQLGEGRKNKVNANNQLYERVMRMARDGARRAEEEDMRRKFVFSKIADMIEAELEASLANPQDHEARRTDKLQNTEAA